MLENKAFVHFVRNRRFERGLTPYCYFVHLRADRGLERLWRSLEGILADDDPINTLRATYAVSVFLRRGDNLAASTNIIVL
jgi:hypothetical protein